MATQLGQEKLKAMVAELAKGIKSEKISEPSRSNWSSSPSRPHSMLNWMSTSDARSTLLKVVALATAAVGIMLNL